MSRSEIDAFIRASLVQEAQRRTVFHANILEVVKGSYTLSRLAIKRGKVYSLLARKLNLVNNQLFKSEVKKVLFTLGVLPVCVHKTYLFRGMHGIDELDPDRCPWNAYQIEKLNQETISLGTLE